jgi:hypothetical protein
MIVKPSFGLVNQCVWMNIQIIVKLSNDRSIWGRLHVDYGLLVALNIHTEKVQPEWLMMTFGGCLQTPYCLHPIRLRMFIKRLCDY